MHFPEYKVSDCDWIAMVENTKKTKRGTELEGDQYVCLSDQTHFLLCGSMRKIMLSEAYKGRIGTDLGITVWYIHFWYTLTQLLHLKILTKVKLKKKKLSYNQLCPVSAEREGKCISKNSVQAARSCDSWQAQGLLEKTPVCASKRLLPLFAPLEITTTKWPIISASVAFFHIC